MRYHKFNRDRSIFGLRKYEKSLKKTSYMIRTNRSKQLNSLDYENEIWGGLIEAWKGYIIAKVNMSMTGRSTNAAGIQKLQNELALPVSSFPDIIHMGSIKNQE
jgi:hypothetical protein